MHEAVRALAIIGYLAAIAAAAGYAKLLIKQPRSRPIAFIGSWLALAAVFSIGFHRWGVPGIERHFARHWAQEFLAAKPGVRLVAARHADVAAAIEAVASVVVRKESKEQVVAASVAYAEAVQKYSGAYLSVASDEALLAYMREQIDFLEVANDASGVACGAILNQRWSTLLPVLEGLDVGKLQAARDAAFLSAFTAPHPPLSAERAEKVDALMTQFLEQTYGPTKARMFLSFIGAPTPPSDPELCSMGIEAMRYALLLPEPDRQDAIRAFFLVNESGEATPGRPAAIEQPI